MFGRGTVDVQLIPKTGQPMDARVATEPGPLTFGVVTSALLGVGDGGGEVPFAGEMASSLAIPDGFEGLDARVVPLTVEVTDLVEEAGGEHPFDAAVDLVVEGRAGRIEAQEQ